MVLEVDNTRIVDLNNSWSAFSCTCHTDVRQYFLWESKEKTLSIVKWIPSAKNVADIFTKNLYSLQFEEFAKAFVKEDEYTTNPE